MENIDTFIKRKHGQQKIEYLHPKLEETLKETYGIIVYQEQVMRIASEVAGYSSRKRISCAVLWGRRTKRAWPH